MRERSRARAEIAAGAAVAGAAGAVYLFRKWQRKSSATAEESRRRMPLDEEVAEPTFLTNRAITIRALPQHIWPWIAQMGEPPRGGFYGYRPVERLLGMKVVRNADDVLPEWQNPQVGDALDRAGRVRVKAVQRNEFLVVGLVSAPEYAGTWTLALYPIDGTTRLVSRCRARLPKGIRGRAWRVLLDAGQFLMERKMLAGIRHRAEKLAARTHFDILPERKAG